MPKFDKGADTHRASPRFRRRTLSSGNGQLLSDRGLLAVAGRRVVYHQRLQKRRPSEFSPTRGSDPRTFVGAPRLHCRDRSFEQRRIWSNSILQDGREGPSRDHHATFGLKVRVL